MAGLGQIRASPQDGGRVVLVVRRSAVGQRELPTEAVLDQNAGLVGDNWLARGSKSMADGSADPERQVTVMNARAAGWLRSDHGWRASQRPGYFIWPELGRPGTSKPWNICRAST